MKIRQAKKIVLGKWPKSRIKFIREMDTRTNGQYQWTNHPRFVRAYYRFRKWNKFMKDKNWSLTPSHRMKDEFLKKISCNYGR